MDRVRLSIPAKLAARLQAEAEAEGMTLTEYVVWWLSR